MDDLKKRLIEEQAELDGRLERLNNFNSSEKANTIDPIQKDLLIIQAGAMYTYNEILKIRINRL